MMPLNLDNNPRSVRLPAAAPNRSPAHERMAQRAAWREAHGDPFISAELDRICGLPITPAFDPAELEEFNRTHLLAHAYAQGFRFFPVQSEALAAFEAHRHLFGIIKVGWGKTLLSLCIAHHAYTTGTPKILLLVPSQVLYQLIERDIPWARTRVPISVPIHILGGHVKGFRQALAASGRKGLYILPYSLLSTADTHDNLAAIDPDLIIADEAHHLANASAARTRRVVRFLQAREKAGRPVRLAVMSGTITGKSVTDYAHLLNATLVEHSPLPRDAALCRDWCFLLDAAAASPDAPPPPGTSLNSILPLLAWAKQQFPRERGGYPADVFGFRRAYAVRLNSAPGVVASGEAEIGTSLVLANRPVANHQNTPGWATLAAHIERVEQQWLTPNGDEIEHAIHKFKWLNELRSGFYNELVWPAPEVLARRRHWTVEEAAEILKRAQIHHAAGQDYARRLRDFLLSTSRPGLDTPFLVGQEMAQHGGAKVPRDLYDLWRVWKDLDFEHRPDRDSRAVRVCPFKVDAAVAWAQDLERPGALLWVYHQELGEWLYEALQAAGLPAVYCPAGELANQSILDHGNAGKLVVASIKAHGTGKNLQHFSQQYVVEWPRDARAAEQLLGRTHRNGQTADELVVTTNQTLLFDHQILAACLNDSLYIHQTTKVRQKLIYASYDPLPPLYPPAVLAQVGLDVQALDREGQAALTERFGGYAK